MPPRLNETGAATIRPVHVTFTRAVWQLTRSIVLEVECVDPLPVLPVDAVAVDVVLDDAVPDSDVLVELGVPVPAEPVVDAGLAV